MDTKVCECCGRTPDQSESTAELFESNVFLCGDCCIMYHALWRIERSRQTPDVHRFLREISDGSWRPTGHEKYEELAALARQKM